MKKTIKTWDTEPSYEELIKPLTDILNKHCTIDKPYKNGIEYDGLPFYGSLLATCFDSNEKLTKYGIKKALDNNQNLFDILLHMAFLYGYSQKEYQEDNDRMTKLLRDVLPDVMEANEKLISENKRLKTELEMLKK